MGWSSSGGTLLSGRLTLGVSIFRHLPLSRTATRAEIQRILTLAIADIRAVIAHEHLLQPDGVAVPLVEANGPGVAVHLVRILLGDAADVALLYGLWVSTADVLDDL